MTITPNDKLRHIVQHAYANAPAVRAIFDQAGINPEDILSPANLEKVPVTSKDRLVELQAADPPFGGFLAVPAGTLKHIFISPGPLYEPDAGESPVMDTIHEICTIAGFVPGDVVINTFGYHYIPTALAIDKVLQKMGITVIPAGVGNADLQIKMMLDLKVTGYVGTPSWLMTLIQKAEENQLNFNAKFDLHKVLVSAEPLPTPMRQAFVDKYGLKVTNAYGTAELGFLAYNIEGGLAMRLLETSIIQIAHPESGQTAGAGEVGEVVVTTFNETYPLIRLGTGDLAMNVGPADGQRQGERAIILVGRVGDAIKVRGLFIHPNQLRFAIGQVPEVTTFQAVVTRPGNRDEISLRTILAEPAANRQALTDSLTTAVQSVCRVKMDRIEFVSEEDWGDEQPVIKDMRIWE